MDQKGLNKDYYAIGQFSSQLNETLTTKMEISEIIVHPNYDNRYRDNDLAICVLRFPVSIMPICLPKARNTFIDVYRKKILAYGWKAEIDKDEIWPSGAANLIQMRMQSRKTCNELYSKSFSSSIGFFCAAGIDLEQHCNGKSKLYFLEIFRHLKEFYINYDNFL